MDPITVLVLAILAYVAHNWYNKNAGSTLEGEYIGDGGAKVVIKTNKLGTFLTSPGGGPDIKFNKSTFLAGTPIAIDIGDGIGVMIKYDAKTQSLLSGLKTPETTVVVYDKKASKKK